MNPKPIEAARDVDLRVSPKAMQRAAHRAREIAAQTGTAIVVSHRGVIETIMIESINPGTQNASPRIQEQAQPYGDAS